jgi:hypothetical protein
MSDLHRRQLLAGIGGALTVGLAGCGSSSGPDTEADSDPGPAPGTGTPADTPTETETPTPTDTPSGTARVRVAHMSPDAPTVSTIIDGATAPGNIGIPYDGVGDYTAVSAGTHRVTLTELGNPDNVLFDREVRLGAADYTFVAAGEVVDADPPFRVLPLVDDNSDPGEMARLRGVHVAPDVGAVDVTVAAGRTLFDGIEFTESGYVSVEPGDYTAQVRLDTANDGGEVVYDRDVTLEAGSVYTAFAAGYFDVEFASDTSFGVDVVEDATP